MPSEKQFKKQLDVGHDVMQQLINGSEHIFGVMIESHLKEGNQKVDVLSHLDYGRSITDACLGWEDTEMLLRDLAAAVRQKNKA